MTEEKISQALSAGTTEGKVEGLKAVLTECGSAEGGAGLERIVEAMCQQSLDTNRSLVDHYLSVVKSLGETEAYEEAALAGLKSFGSQTTDFEDVDATLRYGLFDYYVHVESYGEAARILSGLAREPRYSEIEKAELYVKIAETFLEEDESVDAEAYVSKASTLMHAVPSENWSLQLRYRVTLARTLDARRKFLEAAISYYELSQARHEKISTDDLVALLAKAVTCALLGPAGPQRARILATLYKDERISAQMAPSTDYHPHATILTKMCNGQLVYKHDIAALELSLLPHHKALLPDGLTIPERATIQHNLVALSHIYANLSFNQLATLLDIQPERALHVAAKMISDNRLSASIDQVDGLLIFLSSSSTNNHASLQAFDEHITALCNQVNFSYDKIEPLLTSSA